ncbi:unnamed protein product, partial [Didymodactylos carnosus]
NSVNVDDIVDNDAVSIFDYFFNCLNSKSSVVRLNVWQCLHLIVDDISSTVPFSFSSLTTSNDCVYIEKCLTIIKTFKYFQTKLSPLIKRSLVKVCHLETNVLYLHQYTLFIIENSGSDDYDVLCDLSLAFIKRHNILLSLLELDKEKQYELTIVLFEFVSMYLLKMFEQSILDDSLKIDKNNTIPTTISTFPSSSSSKCYLSLSVESTSVLYNIYLTFKTKYSVNDFSVNISQNDDTLPKSCHIRIESCIIEFLIIFLSNFDFDIKNDNIQTAQGLKHLFFPSTISTLPPCFTSIKQTIAQIPIKQNEQQTTGTMVDDDENHFYPFPINDNNTSIDTPTTTTTTEITRKRHRSSSPVRSSKYLVTSSIVHNTIESQQNIFMSNDVQHFIYKSKNSEFVKIFVQHANIDTCLKLIKTFNVPYENIRYVCSKLDSLLNESNLSLKELNYLIKQSSFLLPIINAWINEQMAEAIKLGQTLTKIIEKKKLK